MPFFWDISGIVCRYAIREISCMSEIISGNKLSKRITVAWLSNCHKLYNVYLIQVDLHGWGLLLCASRGLSHSMSCFDHRKLQGFVKSLKLFVNPLMATHSGTFLVPNKVTLTQSKRNTPVMVFLVTCVTYPIFRRVLFTLMINNFITSIISWHLMVFKCAH